MFSHFPHHVEHSSTLDNGYGIDVSNLVSIIITIGFYIVKK